MSKYILMGLVLSFCIASCSKSNSGGGSTSSSSTAPSNVSVTAVATTDSSGNATITVKATNASSYIIDYGDDSVKAINSSTISLTHKYPATGTYTINVTANSNSGLTATGSASVVIAKKLTLLWSDEFNIDGPPNPANWSYNLGNNNGWGNNELENYTSNAENAYVQGGYLNITAIKENSNGFAYSSARIVTENKVAFKYGTVLMRAMLPTGGGTWPALWMLGADYATNPWPACGEMDIMEEIGNNPGVIYGTLHYPGHSGANGNGATTKTTSPNTTFHVYGLQWSPLQVQITVDGVVYQTVQNNSSLPFNANFFFIFNVAMGGDFGGTVDPNFTSSTMQVDYVRVYQ